jgi:RNA polymerase sigma factor (TIGR02999 family)
MNEFTQILKAIQEGDSLAPNQLLPLVYNELRELAAQKMVQEKSDHTLQPTALVHEAYLRLVGDQNFENRKHFFGAAAEAMRRILIDNARKKNRLKRGGGQLRIELDRIEAIEDNPIEDLLTLDEALNKLAESDSSASELVKLRYFGGLSMPQAAEMLGISLRSAERLWTYAKAWLREAIDKN